MTFIQENDLFQHDMRSFLALDRLHRMQKRSTPRLPEARQNREFLLGCAPFLILCARQHVKLMKPSILEPICIH